MNETVAAFVVYSVIIVLMLIGIIAGLKFIFT
jgi:hypothetical protein